jgi:hypothetical protein
MILGYVICNLIVYGIIVYCTLFLDEDWSVYVVPDVWYLLEQGNTSKFVTWCSMIVLFIMFLPALIMWYITALLIFTCAIVYFSIYFSEGK